MEEGNQANRKKQITVEFTEDERNFLIALAKYMYSMGYIKKPTKTEAIKQSIKYTTSALLYDIERRRGRSE